MRSAPPDAWRWRLYLRGWRGDGATEAGSRAARSDQSETAHQPMPPKTAGTTPTRLTLVITRLILRPKRSIPAERTSIPVERTWRIARRSLRRRWMSAVRSSQACRRTDSAPAWGRRKPCGRPPEDAQEEVQTGGYERSPSFGPFLLGGEPGGEDCHAGVDGLDSHARSAAPTRPGGARTRRGDAFRRRPAAVGHSRSRACFHPRQRGSRRRMHGVAIMPRPGAPFGRTRSGGSR